MFSLKIIFSIKGQLFFIGFQYNLIEPIMLQNLKIFSIEFTKIQKNKKFLLMLFKKNERIRIRILDFY
jgi:hypothetical protein